MRHENTLVGVGLEGVGGDALFPRRLCSCNQQSRCGVTRFRNYSPLAPVIPRKRGLGRGGSGAEGRATHQSARGSGGSSKVALFREEGICQRVA